MSVRTRTFAAMAIGAVLLLPATAALAGGVVTVCDDAHLATALSGGGTVTFNCGSSPFTLHVTSRHAISAVTTIDGGGVITLDGGGSTGLFTVSAAFTVQNITLANGRTTALNDGGAAISSNGGAVTIDHSTIVGNSTGDAGCGAIAVSGAALTITDSTLSGNHEDAAAQAGLLCINSGGSLAMSNSTVSGNYSAPNGGGGAISLAGPATFTNCTIASNTSHNDNGAVNTFATVTFTDTIIADNPGGNCLSAGGTFVDGGHNLQYPGNDCGATIPVAYPSLLPLANNGGPTQTMALLYGSPAINAGDPATCLPADQRGHARVGTCDIGAFEFDPSAPGALPVPLLGWPALVLLALGIATAGLLFARRV